MFQSTLKNMLILSQGKRDLHIAEIIGKIGKLKTGVIYRSFSDINLLNLIIYQLEINNTINITSNSIKKPQFGSYSIYIFIIHCDFLINAIVIFIS